MALGGKLTSHPYPFGFTAKSWDEVEMTLSQIKLPYKLLGFTVDEGKFHILLSLTKPVRRVSKTEITET